MNEIMSTCIHHATIVWWHDTVAQTLERSYIPDVRIANYFVRIACALLKAQKIEQLNKKKQVAVEKLKNDESE